MRLLFPALYSSLACSWEPMDHGTLQSTFPPRQHAATHHKGARYKACNFYGCMARVLNKHCRAVCAEEAYFAPKREHQGSGWVKHEQKVKAERTAPHRVANAAEQVPYWPDQAL